MLIELTNPQTDAPFWVNAGRVVMVEREESAAFGGVTILRLHLAAADPFEVLALDPHGAALEAIRAALAGDKGERPCA